MLAYSADSMFCGDACALEGVAVEVVARPQVRDAPRAHGALRAAQEPGQLEPVVAAQQPRVVGHADRAGLDLGGEVDLVQPDVRVAEERRVGDRAHALHHPVDGRGWKLRAARARAMRNRGRAPPSGRPTGAWSCRAARCSRPSPERAAWVSERGFECRVGPAARRPERRRLAQARGQLPRARRRGERRRRGPRAPRSHASSARTR